MAIPRGGIVEGFRNMGVKGCSVLKGTVFERLLEKCLSEKATQLHLLPTPTGYIFCYRCMGKLVECRVGGDIEYYLILVELKTKARIDVNEKRRALSGVFSVDIGDRRLDLHVNTVPTAIGNKKEAAVVYVVDVDDTSSDKSQ
jgi:type II secretory ATPase GspE/PulE/Tfp pilus assembly ATPase PilB-like protein